MTATTPRRDLRGRFATHQRRDADIALATQRLVVDARRRLAAHPDTPADQLAALLHDPDADVRETARWSLRETNRDVRVKSYRWLLTLQRSPDATTPTDPKR